MRSKLELMVLLLPLGAHGCSDDTVGKTHPDYNGTIVLNGEERDALVGVVVQAWTNSPGSVRLFASASGVSVSVEVEFEKFNDLLHGRVVHNDGPNVVVLTVDGVMHGGSVSLLDDSPVRLTGEFNAPSFRVSHSVEVTSVSDMTASCAYDDNERYVPDPGFESTSCADALRALDESPLWIE